MEKPKPILSQQLSDANDRELCESDWPKWQAKCVELSQQLEESAAACLALYVQSKRLKVL